MKKEPISEPEPVKKEPVEAKSNTTAPAEDSIKSLKNALGGKAPEPMGSGSLSAINFGDILQQSQQVLKDLSSTDDEKRFLRDLRKINDLNQKRYESELQAHGKRQDQMKLMLVKEKISQIKTRESSDREGVVGLAAGNSLSKSVGDVKDKLLENPTSSVEDLNARFSSSMNQLSSAFIEKAKQPVVSEAEVKPAADASENKKKSLKDMKKEQSNIKKEVKQIRKMLSQKDDETDKLK